MEATTSPGTPLRGETGSQYHGLVCVRGPNNIADPCTPGSLDASIDVDAGSAPPDAISRKRQRHKGKIDGMQELVSAFGPSDREVDDV